ncbi:WRKY transcription factor 55-like [Aristolochia californica]|uniref:WRKY transcription factor 55-like n=1 Tax=Aristolochia californica TaxID=171875 RepID=UPI0035DF5A72
MEESCEIPLSLILHGCQSAKELESNLPSMVNQPGLLLYSCQEIAALFNKAVIELSTSLRSSPGLMTSNEQPMELLPAQTEMGTSEANEGDFARRSRKRKDSKEKRTQKVPAPRTGNLEVPPDDGHTWRKYGQKEILGLRFPRSYYRCTHSKLYGCEAKKHVQRVDDDPFMFEVTYWGNHSCQTPTTPLLLPSMDNISMVQIGPAPSPLPSTSIHLTSSWFSPDFASKEKDENTPIDPFLRMLRPPPPPPTIVESSSRSGGGKETESDLADMFYFPSSSNRIDTIFSSKEDSAGERTDYSPKE